MPLWPKSFHFIGENLATARVARKLRRKHAAVPAQRKAFAALLPKLASARVWRAAGLEAGMPYETFRTRVAPCSYQHLAPSIERMKRGEPDLLWPGRTVLFARTSGTTGPAKLLPVTEEMLAHFRTGIHEAFLYYTARIGHAGVARCRYLFGGGSTAMEPLPEAKPHEAYVANLAGIRAAATPIWAEKHLIEPAASISQLANWDEKVTALAGRSARRDIGLLAGIPSWTTSLARAVRTKAAEAGRSAANLQELWPNLECYAHTGMSIAPYYEELRELLGPTVKFHDVLFAAEGYVATQDGEPAGGLRLMADCGVFFEFLPVSELEHSPLETLGTKAVPLADVKTDVDYAVLVTTPAGLARYLLGDIVRFNSVTPPRLVHVGRAETIIRGAGEWVLERDLTEALVTVCKRHAWTITNFHVAPLFDQTATGALRGHHEWWVELRPGTTATPTGPQMAGQLDVELRRLNPRYAAHRQSGALEMPVVRLVMPGVFEYWLRYHQGWDGSRKMPRARNDREIADNLAQITSFARD